MKAKVATEASESKARMEKMTALRRRAGSCVRVLVEGGSDLAARRAVRSTFAVRPATSSTWPPKRAIGSELLRLVTSVSTGAMV